MLVQHGIHRAQEQHVPYGMCGDGKPVAMIFAKLQAHYHFRWTTTTLTNADRIFVVPGGFHVQQLLLEVFGGAALRKACDLDIILFDLGRKTQVIEYKCVSLILRTLINIITDN